MKFLAALLLSTSLAHAGQMERCSYKTEHDGKVTETIETPDLADGSNAKRFVDIVRKEDAGEEGWKGYRTFGVNCRQLDTEKPEWHMFVQTHNGQVSLSHGLTEDACFYTLSRLRPNHCDNCAYMVQGSDFERGECFK